MIEEIRRALASMLKTRPTWQECIGQRPHMIEETAVGAGYTARDSYEVVDRVAIVDASGVLVNAAWDGWRTSSYGRIQGEIQGAAEDPNIDGILLRINSPGGETTNAFETADEIIAAGKKKPVWAIADSTAYSAGYLLASAAGKIYVGPKTGGVGSIGVYAVHLDLSKMLEEMGVKATFVENPKGKTEGHPYKPLSESARKDLQAEVDRLAGMFFEHVAKRRGLEVDAVRKMSARTFEGSEAAVAAGLADRAGSLGVALSEFRAHLDARKQSLLMGGMAAQETSSSTAASAVTSQQEDDMSDIKADAKPAPAQAAAPPAATEKPKEPTQEAAAAESHPYADSEEVIALCAVAGLPAAKAHEFIAARKSAKDVRNQLIAARASASGEEIVSQVKPNTGTASNPNDSPIVKAAERLAGKEKK
jgi:signal peptide peptidase SppA